MRVKEKCQTYTCIRGFTVRSDNCNKQALYERVAPDYISPNERVSLPELLEECSNNSTPDADTFRIRRVPCGVF